MKGKNTEIKEALEEWYDAQSTDSDYDDPESRIVIIKNLPVGEKAFYATFAVFGRIEDFKYQNAYSGAGFVQYESIQSAHQAIQAFSDMTVFGRKVHVGFECMSSGLLILVCSDEDSGSTKRHLYVKYLPDSFGDKELKELFAEYGAITSASVAMDKNGKSRCFGLVRFRWHENAEEAISGLNGKLIGGKRLFVDFVQKKRERDKMHRRIYGHMHRERIRNYGMEVCVRNLDERCTEQQLRTAFSACGSIQSVHVDCNEHGICKGIAYVCFSTPEEADRGTLHD